MGSGFANAVFWLIPIAAIVGDAPLRRRLIAGGYETARRFTLEAQAARMMAEVSTRLHVSLKQTATVPAA